MNRVVVIGSSNIDLICRVPHLPAPGETVAGGDLVTVCGGKGANQAVAAARSGAEVHLITRVGDDAHGHLMRDTLEREGVTVLPAEPDPVTPTGTALILVDAQGENTIAVAPGANHQLLPDALDVYEDVIASSAVVLCQMEVLPKTVAAALALADRHDVFSVLNYAPTAGEPERVIGAGVSLLVVNEVEAGWITGADPSDERALSRGVDTLLGNRVRAVAVTLGKRGAILASGEGRRTIDGFSVNPVDTTGAGDTFCGALCAQLARGASLPEAVRYGCAAGALATTALGAQSAIPGRSQIEALLTSHQHAT
ncbi:ribokinase [Phycisphaeraceae bacterium D3-23]